MISRCRSVSIPSPVHLVPGSSETNSHRCPHGSISNCRLLPLSHRGRDKPMRHRMCTREWIWTDDTQSNRDVTAGACSGPRLTANSNDHHICQNPTELSTSQWSQRWPSRSVRAPATRRSATNCAHAAPAPHESDAPRPRRSGALRAVRVCSYAHGTSAVKE